MGRDTAHDSDRAMSADANTTRSQQRLLLWVGLGGLLILLITLGISAVSFLRNIESRHESIRADFLARMQVLVQLRNNVYRSGTRVHATHPSADASLRHHRGAKAPHPKRPSNGLAAHVVQAV